MLSSLRAGLAFRLEMNDLIFALSGGDAPFASPQSKRSLVDASRLRFAPLDAKLKTRMPSLRTAFVGRCGFPKVQANFLPIS